MYDVVFVFSADLRHPHHQERDEEPHPGPRGHRQVRAEMLIEFFKFKVLKNRFY